MSNAFRSTIQDLASGFAAAVVDAIRRADIQDIVEFTTGARRPPGRHAASASPAARGRVATHSAGHDDKVRLPRRTTADIETAVDKVVTLLKSHKSGLRAEQIRELLGMEAREMPRILKDGLARRRLKCKGQKRSTTYWAT